MRKPDMQSPRQFGVAIGIAFVLIVGALGFSAYSSLQAHQAATAAQADSKSLTTLLTNGKTTSAVSSKQTKAIVQEIEKLIIDYHAQSQQSVAQAARGAAELPGLIHQVEVVISENVDAQIGALVLGNRANGVMIKQILCAAVTQTHPSDPVIKRDCAGVLP